MQRLLMTVAAVAVGIVIGSVNGERLRAQQSSSVFYVENNEISDGACYFKQFAPLAQASIKASGGHYVAAGKPVEFDGPSAHDRAVVLAFDNIDQLRAWHDSAQYRQARSVGDRCAKFHAFS